MGKKCANCEELKREIKDLRIRLEETQKNLQQAEIQRDAMKSVLKIYRDWGRLPE
jgi:uncharacterized protein (DUF3084 family)